MNYSAVDKAISFLCYAGGVALLGVLVLAIVDAAVPDKDCESCCNQGLLQAEQDQ